jgi:hypothetical protein
VSRSSPTNHMWSALRRRRTSTWSTRKRNVEWLGIELVSFSIPPNTYFVDISTDQHAVSRPLEPSSDPRANSSSHAPSTRPAYGRDDTAPSLLDLCPTQSPPKHILINPELAGQSWSTKSG